MSDIVERLREVEWSGKHDGRKRDYGTTCWYRNPDGPKAADEIERLQARLCAVVELIGVIGDTRTIALVAEAAGFERCDRCGGEGTILVPWEPGYVKCDYPFCIYGWREVSDE